ncbi:DUF4262 domain-containing protein [Methylopila sp. Yamaguchi]|uniref:DUF4262 domain-containing protein n=1 Tax=Methylopila sp. Yamaguchi TaxID=1437817 RepID=UPI000CB8AA35|nr:DUF4262 domain-containing protein [Methylopila sp. Yamaguchi]GBD48028.1 hypothetical protein METY_1241 [Methylopila sp. Yamaguchi]
MLTALDKPSETLDGPETAFVAAVREHGWFRTQVLADGEAPGFSFSTGFWLSVNQPEILIFGMRSDVAHDVLWDLFRRAGQGETLPVGRHTDQVFANVPACLFPIDRRRYAEYLGWSRWFYCGDDFPCLQLVWPDPSGLFPWEQGFDAAFDTDQIDLTEFGWNAELRQ